MIYGCVYVCNVVIGRWSDYVLDADGVEFDVDGIKEDWIIMILLKFPSLQITELKELAFYAVLLILYRSKALWRTERDDRRVTGYIPA